ncbi:MAG: SGNH/GDSL hydrolase family protein [Lentisphaeria bacterium]|nr:SGNH/GDSL hydrolase family protein [Lentisphaeria bacterium]
MLKLWDRPNRFIQQECCMFSARDEVQLMFPVETIMRITTPVTGKEYFPGVDFEYTPGSRTIRRLPGSSMPYIPESMMRPGEDAVCYPESNARAVIGACDGGRLFFNNENFFAENQISVDYRAVAVDFDPELDHQSDRLPLFRKKLKDRNAVRVMLLGDSISEGFNATAYTGCEPFSPPYIEQTTRYLSDRFRAKIDLLNHAVEGTGCVFAESNARVWVKDRPDLLIIAYGMNDFSKMTGEEFIERNKNMIRSCRQLSPECEIVLLASMTGHPFWEPTKPGRDAEFAVAARDFVAASGRDIAIADVQKVWKKFLERKDFYDLSGNGVNHPNDYGHRIYASVLLHLLAGAEMF